MPTTKNAQLRYQVLDRCFQDKNNYYSIDDLLDEVNERLRAIGSHIELRQLRQDIEYMRSSDHFNAPIEAVPYWGKKCYYHYSRPFSIYNNELSPDEYDKLETSIRILKRYCSSPSYAWLEESLSQIECKFGFVANSNNLVSFQENADLKGLEFLSQVIEATVEHRVLDINYQPYGRDERLMTIHPYYVKQYNNRWFLIGYYAQKELLSNLALDRIQSITEAQVHFIKNESYDFDHFFDEVVGVTIPKDVPVEHIKLQFTKNRFPYVVSKPIHHSQQVVDEDQHIISLDVRPNFELEQQIFSFGNDVEVLEPETFRRKMANKIQENYEKYFPVHDDCTDKA